MLIKEIKLAFRRIIKESNFSLMKLASLTLGISFSFLIFMYVSNQFSYDDHLPNADNIYRVASDFTIGGHQDIYANAPRPMGKTLVEEYPEVIAATKMVGFFGLTVHAGYLKTEEDHFIHSSDIFVADSSFLEVFELPLILGSPKALHSANSAIVSESLARKLYQEENPIGKTVTLENRREVQIAGVFKDDTKPTYMNFDIVISYTTFFPTNQSEIWWYGGHVITYIKTIEGFDPANIYDNWDPFFEKYMKPTFDQLGGTAKIILQPMKELYLAEEYIWEPYPHNSKQNLYIFMTIGFFLILVAGFNYMNLSLSQSFNHYKTVAVQKILGSGKMYIIRQHLLSSVLVSLFAGLLSISLISTLVPVVNQMTDRFITISFIDQPSLILGILGMSVLLGILANLYPAIFETRYQPADLKKQVAGNSNGILLRKIFVIGQQAIAVALIILTLVVIDQINFIKGRDIGFDKENLIIMNLKDMDIRDNMEVLVDRLKQVPGVTDLTRTDESPETGVNEFTYSAQNSEGEFVSTPSQTIGVGLDFTKTMKIDLLAGRMLQDQDAGYRGVLISAYLADKLGFDPSDAIGTKLRFGDDDEIERKVVGVIDDFNIGSAQVELQSMTIGLAPDQARYFIVRLNESNQQETLMQIEQVWNEYSSGSPFTYSFMNDQLNALLIKEDTLNELLIFGSILIILISNLGLFGLASHTAIQRTKEVGIRKVVGAEKHQLFYSMTKEFLITLSIAFVIGAATAWYFGQAWLQGFAYRTTFDWTNLVVAGIMALSIVIVTLSYHTIKVINGNPVDSLRYE